MSIFRKSTKREQNRSELENILKFNPRYFEEKAAHKIRRVIKGYM